VEASHKPLELILARNLLSSISTPAFLVDRTGVIIFYNEAAGQVLGRRFEESGAMSPHDWGAQFGPFNPDGSHVSFEDLPVTKALRASRPVHDRMCLRSAATHEDHLVEVSALPIVGSEGFTGAMAIFWPVENGDGPA
jgi:PAS domain-containing protein